MDVKLQIAQPIKGYILFKERHYLVNIEKDIFEQTLYKDHLKKLSKGLTEKVITWLSNSYPITLKEASL